MLFLTSIDQCSKFDMAFRKAVLQVLALDPDATHRLLIESGQLQSLSHMTRRAGFRGDNHQDHLGRSNNLM
jgi:hypothetical protein